MGLGTQGFPCLCGGDAIDSVIGVGHGGVMVVDEAFMNNDCILFLYGIVCVEYSGFAVDLQNYALSFRSSG